MRLDLGIASIAVIVPELASHRSSLGTVSQTAYHHLFAPAGAQSRPPTVGRCDQVRACDEYVAPAVGADERTSDLASQAVAAALEATPDAGAKVRSILHTQCTLDQQILGSACLRIQRDHCARATSAITVGQLGTAGVPTAFRLAAMDVAGGGLASVSASDKWMAPFIRRLSGLVTYGDAAGACIVGSRSAVEQPIAVIERCVTSCRPSDVDLWNAPGTEQRERVLAHTTRVIDELLRGTTAGDRDGIHLLGDGYGRDMHDRVALASGLSRDALDDRFADIHLSAASPLWALCCAVEASVARREPLRAVVWTTSPAGHAGAMLVQCTGDAIKTSNGWARRSRAAPARGKDISLGA